MVLRWTASALLATEKKFRRIMGYQQLWILVSNLQGEHEQNMIAGESKVA